jgi:protein gp37
MGDLFHEDITNEQIAAVFGVMAATPQHTYLLLTKRPKRMVEWFAWLEEARHEVSATPRDFCELMSQGPLNRVVETGDDTWPLPNVWVGVSAEDQETLEERWEQLRQVPAVVRWLSYEPAIGSMRLSHEMLTGLDDEYPEEGVGTKLDWVVVGGESGHGARSCNVNWIRLVVEQCQKAGVPVHVKQLGARPYETKPTPSGCGFDPWDMLSRNPRDEAAHKGWFKGWTLVKTATGSQFVRYPKISDRKGAVMDDWPQELRIRDWPEVR